MSDPQARHTCDLGLSGSPGSDTESEQYVALFQCAAITSVFSGNIFTLLLVLMFSFFVRCSQKIPCLSEFPLQYWVGELYLIFFTFDTLKGLILWFFKYFCIVSHSEQLTGNAETVFFLCCFTVWLTLGQPLTLIKTPFPANRVKIRLCHFTTYSCNNLFTQSDCSHEISICKQIPFIILAQCSQFTSL